MLSIKGYSLVCVLFADLMNGYKALILALFKKVAPQCVKKIQWIRCCFCSRVVYSRCRPHTLQLMWTDAFFMSFSFFRHMGRVVGCIGVNRHKKALIVSGYTGTRLDTNLWVHHQQLQQVGQAQHLLNRILCRSCIFA